MRSARIINIGLALVLAVIVLVKLAMLYGAWNAGLQPHPGVADGGGQTAPAPAGAAVSHRPGGS